MTVEITVTQLAKAYPESLSCAFSFKNIKSNIFYFKGGEPTFTPKDIMYVSKCDVLEFNQWTGELKGIELLIPRGEIGVIESHTIISFYNRVILKKHDIEQEPDKFAKGILEEYSKWGF